MEGFSYNNIFETKGIEYLVIILFFAILIPFWFILNKQNKITKKIQKTLGILTAGVLKIPQGLFYSRNHTWTHLEKSGIAKVGLDDLLLRITGEVQFRNLKKPGESVGKGELIAEVYHYDKVLKVYSPISGEILGANDLLTVEPGILNEDPYIKGWMYKVKPFNWVAETNTYFLAGDAIDWSVKELERFKDFLAESMKKYSPDSSKVILQDGGELRDHILPELPEEVWQDFQTSFLSMKD
jgi:glycine cleavage system H protein